MKSGPKPIHTTIMNFGGDAKSAQISADKLKNGKRAAYISKKNMALIFDVMVNKLYGQEGLTAVTKSGRNLGQEKTLLPNQVFDKAV